MTVQSYNQKLVMINGKTNWTICCSAHVNHSESVPFSGGYFKHGRWNSIFLKLSSGRKKSFEGIEKFVSVHFYFILFYPILFLLT